MAKLSIKVCEASVGNYTDQDMLDTKNSSANIEAMLLDIGFSDVKTNNYYNQEKLRHSIGCVVGQRTLKDGDKNYTLIAVFPEGAGYKQEWCGNLTVGTEGLHDGFKQACDEVLRFIIKYIMDPVHRDGDTYTFDTELSQTIFDTLGKAVYTVFYNKEPETEEEWATCRGFEYNLFYSCISEPAEDVKTARSNLYFLLSSYLPEKYKFISEQIKDGSGLCTDFVKDVLPGLLDLPGGEKKTYAHIADVADDNLRTLIVGAYQKAIDRGFYAQDSEQYNNLIYYRDTLNNNMPTLREAVTYFLFYEEGKTFDTASNIRNAATFADAGTNNADGFDHI